MNAAGFLARWAALLMGSIGLVAAFNIAIDPYALWGTPRIEGISEFKTTAHSKVRQTKPEQVARSGARTVVIGNSRPEAGLDPLSRCWPGGMRPIYNFGIPGAGVLEQIRNARYALTLPNVRNIVITVDFTDFLTRPVVERLRANNDAATNQRAALSSGEPQLLATLRNRLLSALSLDALTDSIATLASQHGSTPTDVTALGFNNGGMFASVIAYEGQSVLFAQKMRELAERYPAGAWHFDNASPETKSELAALSHLVRKARTAGVSVVLVMNPFHQAYLDLLTSHGYGSDIENWKAAMRDFAAEHALPLWDFATRHQYAMSHTRDGHSQWFWEPAHYRPELGDRMLARMFSSCQELGSVEDFGEIWQPGRRSSGE